MDGLLGTILNPASYVLRTPKPQNLLSTQAQNELSTPGSPAAQRIGIQAKSPTNNVQPPPNTLSKGFTLTPSEQNNMSSIGTSGQISSPGSVSGVGGRSEDNPYPTQTSQPNYQVGPGLYGQLITGLANQSQPGAAYNAALPAYNTAVQNLADFNTQLAGQQSNINQTGWDLAAKQGAQSALAQRAAETQAALQGAVQQQQTALGLGLQQQGLAQQALGTAAGLAAPVPGQALGFYQPANNQYVPYGGQGGQGAFGAGNVLGSVGFGQQYTQTLLPAFNAAKGYEDTISNYIDQNPDLNATPSTFLNSLDQWLRGGQLGDPRYQSLVNYITEYTNTLSPILGAGGGITNFKTQLSQSLVNGTAPREAIKEVLANIRQAAQDKLQNMVSGAQGGGQVAGGQPGVSGGSLWNW